MKVKDITRDWIRANFDIDKERKMKVICSRDVETHGFKDEFIGFDYPTNGKTLEECIEHLKNSFDNFSKSFGAEVENIKLYEERDWDSRELRLVAKKEVLELDEDVIIRLQKREKERLKKKLDKQEVEERERKQYEKLKKKFEKGE